MRQWADQDRQNRQDRQDRQDREDRQNRIAPIVELGAGTPLGKYKIVRLVGAGAMGSVYEAEDTETGKRVAIKVLDPQLASARGAGARFQLEGSLTTLVRHPHVVDVIEAGEEGGRGYLVMELLTGEDLGRRLERSGAIAAEETADFLIPVCDAVSAAHRAGITHRDLKPHNIFLAEGYGDAAHPKVLDFGIAISAGTPLPIPDVRGTMKGIAPLVGSPCYLAPEQVVSSRSAGPATDQYALGVIAYECLTGRRPFDGDNLNAVLLAIARSEPARPRDLRPELPVGLEKIVLRAMSRAPTDRFSSVAELGRALLPFASARVRLAWEGILGVGGERAGDGRRAVAADGPDPEIEAPASPSTRTLIGTPIGSATGASRRSPFSPSIQAEAATPSPFVRTLPPEMLELAEVSEPSLVPPVTLAPAIDSGAYYSGDLGSGEETGDRGGRFGRLAPVLANKWVRSAAFAIAVGAIALLVARGRSDEPEPSALIPAAQPAADPVPEASRVPSPRPGPPPVAPLGGSPAVEPVPAIASPAREEAPPAEATAPAEEIVPARPAPEAAPKVAAPAQIERAKTTKPTGPRRKRRVPLLD